MLRNIIDLLQGDLYGVSESIDIAKGINKAPETWKETKQNFKRRLWRLKR